MNSDFASILHDLKSLRVQLEQNVTRLEKWRYSRELPAVRSFGLGQIACHMTRGINECDGRAMVGTIFELLCGCANRW